MTLRELVKQCIDDESLNTFLKDFTVLEYELDLYYKGNPYNTDKINMALIDHTIKKIYLEIK
jgi:hypothetical protein